MKEEFRRKLMNIKRTTISLEQLERLANNSDYSYEEFADVILSLEDEGVLEMVKAKGRNGRNPSIAFRYRIKRQSLQQTYHSDLRQHHLQFHPSLSLDAYYSLPPSQWQDDLPFLEKINHYLYNHGFPSKEVPAPERSVELVGDEKWITEKGGKQLLERVNLWDHFAIIPVSDPLMAAVHPTNLMKEEQSHLIVENKTTYQGLLPALTDTSFSTLIYGSGRKIIKSIEQFDIQFPISYANHTFYYFGDIDREGISIWHGLQKKRSVQPAISFYRACFDKQIIKGKENQRWNDTAIAMFSSFFTEKEQVHLHNVLDSGYYYPQEVLQAEELKNLWRNM